MKIIDTPIDGLKIIEPVILSDSRGVFFESFREEHFLAAKVCHRYVQDNVSYSKKGVLRGLHFQNPPMAQAKLVSVLSGKVFDAVVDLRPKSKTFKQVFTIELSSENHRCLCIPEGFAHGFLSLSDQTCVAYKVSRVYSQAHERGIIWNDPELKIGWPKLDACILSPKDQAFPSLNEWLKTSSS